MWARPIMPIALLFFLLDLSVAVIYEEPMPDGLKGCLKYMETKSNIRRTPSSYVDYMCINKFIFKTPEMRWKPDIVPSIDPILMKDLRICKKMLGLGETRTRRIQYSKRSIGNHLRILKRIKRQSKVQRMEYRMMSNAQRGMFHRAVQLMKADKRVSPNLYDAICNLHPNVRAPNAHYGPAFLGYHRVLLWFFEKQMQRKVPGVFLPFWDSTKDGLMTNPTASVMFSPNMVGTGYGVVNNGPFAGFTHASTGALVRNLGSGGGLMKPKMIYDVVKQTKTENMITPFADSENNLEINHAMVHAYIGGTLDNLNYSPADPLFWMHHCFVDYIWEKQRNNERRNGRNPDTDYPALEDGHNADQTMQPFTNLKNKDGYSSGWINTFYSYRDCPIRCRNQYDCRSPYYKCFRGQCVSRTIGEVYGTQSRAHGRKKRSVDISKGKKVPKPEATPKATYKKPLATYFPFLSNLDDKTGNFYQFKHVQSPVPQPEQVPEETEKPRDLSYEDMDIKSTPLHHSLQNTYTLDGVEDTKNWVYLPCIVYYRRPAEVKYDAHPIRNGKVVADTDVYASSRSDKYRVSKPVKTATSSTCEHIGSGAFKVYVKTYGLNYDGLFTDYAVVDERQSLSFALTQVGVKNPRLGKSTAYVAAYDSCGRTCKARCLIPGSKPARYKPCSGTIKVTPDAPFMYSSDIADAHLHTYNYNSIPPCLSYDKVFLVFYCDQTDSWPWEQTLGRGGGGGVGGGSGKQGYNPYANARPQNGGYAPNFTSKSGGYMANFGAKSRGYPPPYAAKLGGAFFPKSGY